MRFEQIQAHFEPSPGGVFMCRSGAGRQSDIGYSQRKLCFVATDQEFLAGLLLELSKDPECYFVKYSTRAKDGMYLGRCFMLTDSRAGELWRTYKPHPKVMCSIQDDDFTSSFRPEH